jgi:endonuclease/exonuclease/phosphatase family metal-dependent hydrolase
MCCLVDSPAPFLLVAMWTLKQPSYEAMALATMPVASGASAGLPVVVMGDFNVSPRVKGQEQTGPAFFRRMHDESGLVSAYHFRHDVQPGCETHPTFYMNGRRDRSFHIDYCFVPDGWVRRIADVHVGTYDAWRDSDHRPLTVDLDD